MRILKYVWKTGDSFFYFDEEVIFHVEQTCKKLN